ncbi:MAG: hypothetical protein JNK58_02595, partial [Phycisphaerae bacterium]|nr:hypothetical protein [Phycisphaerae bacterium]
CMGRFDDAEAVAPATVAPDSPLLSREMVAEAWLEAVERCGRGEAGGRIVAEFEERFLPTLTVEQAARWRAARGR